VQLNSQEEEASPLVVGSEEEDEEEASVEVEVRLFSITMPSQVIWKGIFRTLVLHEAIVIHLAMSLNIVQYCYLKLGKNKVENGKSIK
jgi:hypothetical protein